MIDRVVYHEERERLNNSTAVDPKKRGEGH